MQISILTHWPGVVIEILEQEFESLYPHHLAESKLDFELNFTMNDDVEYRDWQGWGSDALACGLIFSFTIKRLGE